MAETEPPPTVVSDAGPLIHLDELAALDLLADAGRVLVPRQVWAEVARHRPGLGTSPPAWASIVDPAPVRWPELDALADSLMLGAGERAAILLMREQAAHLLVCDDAAARLAAESLGFTVRGTVGLITRATRRGLRNRDQALDLLRQIPVRSTLHLSPALLRTVIARVEQEDGS